MTRLMEKLKDFAEMGVPSCWMVDPTARRAWNVASGTLGILAEATDGVPRDSGLEMVPAEVLE